MGYITLTNTKYFACVTGWGGFTILAGYIIDSYSQHLNGEKVKLLFQFVLSLYNRKCMYHMSVC